MPRARHLLAGIGLSGSLAAVALAAPVGTAVAAGTAPTVVSGRAVVSGLHGRSAPTSAVGDRLATSALLAGVAVGQRMMLAAQPTASDRVVDRLLSSNWSGAIEKTALGAIKGAAAEWTVPTVRRQSSTPKYSSTWVGVDGALSLDLIQTGTNENTGSAYGSPYAAWVEILPAPQAIIRTRTGVPARVRPGDKMVALVEDVRAGRWVIGIRDVTEHWFFEHNFAFHGAGDSAEWIQEAPTVGGSQSSIADFGNVHFKETLVYGHGAHGLRWYSTAMGLANKVFLDQDGKIRAAPSVPLPAHGSATGQRFSDHYR